jgi:uncharacterized protein YaiE (UPF0345 family)
LIANKYFDSLLDSLSNFNALSGGSWNVTVDMASSLVTFIQQEGNWSLYAGALGLVLEQSPGWKLKAIDEHYFKIYSEGTFYALISPCLFKTMK